MRFATSIFNNASKRIEKFRPAYISFGIFCIINYPIFYFIWINYNRQGYESLTLRIICTCLGIPLLLHKYWPAKLKKLLPLYWLITLAICLPFFFFYMLFKNDGSTVWLMSANTVLFWLLFLVDFLDYLFVLVLGIAAAYLCYSLPIGMFLSIDIAKWWGVWAQIIASILIVAFFAQRKFLLDQEKLESMQIFAATVAHELRTPLRAVIAGVNGIKKLMPKLIANHQQAVTANLPVDMITTQQTDMITKVLDNMDIEVHSSFHIINMLLVNANEENIGKNYQIISMNEAIDAALTHYPFSGSEKSLVDWKKSDDFLFYGNKDIMVHIIFNLLKNALYYVKAANKGSITIWTEGNNHYNYLHFKDTGEGIDASVLPYIFERFYSNTRHGTGIGLAFCQHAIESFQGQITCHSIKGEYAEFIMRFPKK
jgi:signal transduction histidine kinase